MPGRDPILARFGLRLRQCREAKGLTQERLGEKAGLDQTYISGIERGIEEPGIGLRNNRDGELSQESAGRPRSVR